MTGDFPGAVKGFEAVHGFGCSHQEGHQRQLLVGVVVDLNEPLLDPRLERGLQRRVLLHVGVWQLGGEIGDVAFDPPGPGAELRGLGLEVRLSPGHAASPPLAALFAMPPTALLAAAATGPARGP